MGVKLSSQKLEDILAFVTKNWIFSEEKYPGLKGLNHQDRRVFAVRHILEHEMKSLGQLAETIQDCEHGGNFNEQKARDVFAKMLRNTLRLSELLNMSAEELLAELMRHA